MTDTKLHGKTVSEDEALRDISSWSEVNCPKWQQDALRCLRSGRELDENDIKELASLCKGNDQGYNALAAASHQVPRRSAKAVKIKAIHGVENVNALQSGQHLTFCKEGMTVVYGDNGSGKSGYVRILKSACHSRTPASAAKILPDIRKGSSGQQKCFIDYSVGDENKYKDWTPEDPNNEFLAKVSVFDSQAASVHVDKANNVAYTPFPMLVLERLADTCQKVKELISTEIEALKSQTPKSISEPRCGNNTSVGKLLANISGETSVEKVLALATLSEEDKKRQRELEADLINEPLNTAKKLEITVRQLNEANEKLETLQSAVSDAQIAELSKLQSSHRTARAAAQTAAAELFKDYPLQHVGSDVWKKLWEAAREYSELQAYPNLPFPVAATDKHCVLCQQKLDDTAVARLQRFENFVKDKTKSEEERSRKAYQDALDYIEKSDVSIKDISTTADLLSDENRELAKLVRISAIKNKWRLRSILHNHKQEAKEKQLPPAGNWPSEAISQHVESLRERIKGLQAKENSEERKQMRSQLEELKARVWLVTVQEDVIAEIRRREERKILENAIKDTDTNKITRKSGEIAERLVTESLCESFRSEVSKLNVTGLEVELRKEKSSYGTPLFRVCLTNNKLTARSGEVLSEGEHRCVAIAAFLAELATSESDSAIVFDDPVSSLDHTYRDKVAKRLAKEGSRRQVIVFTHDTVFLSFLNDACRKSTTSFNCLTVARTIISTGVVQQDPPIRVQRVESVINRIQKQLNNEMVLFEQGKQDEWEGTSDLLLKRLRKTWERAVEEIIEPVLKRFSNEVKTAGLVKLTVLNDEDCKSMRNAFSRLSEPEHGSAEAINKPTPTPEDIQEEIDALRDWFNGIKDRQSKVKKVKGKK